jgi:hypothetical protein
MELFIQIDENEQTVDHPIMGDNFRQAFPDIDVNNLPSNFARFERVHPPMQGPYEKNHRTSYQKRSDGVWADTYAFDPMTSEEIVALQNQIKAAFAANNGPVSWVFNETTCRFDPPAPYPNDGKPYRWNELTTNWVEIPTPVEGVN